MYTPDNCQDNISEYYLISVYLHYIILTVLTSDNLHPFGKYLKVGFFIHSYDLIVIIHFYIMTKENYYAIHSNRERHIDL